MTNTYKQHTKHTKLFLKDNSPLRQSQQDSNMEKIDITNKHNPSRRR